MASTESALLSTRADEARQDGGWRRIGDSDAYQAVIRLAVILWALLLARSYWHGIEEALTNARGAVGVLGAAQFFAKTCLLAYFLLVAGIALTRPRPISRAEGLGPRIIALLGTNLVYGVGFLPARQDLGAAWLLMSAALLFIGNAFTIAVLLRLGRSFSIMPEARKLVTWGPYAVIRHPLYLAEQTAMLGVFIQFASLPAAALFAAQFLCQFRRMLNEEAVLERAFPDYAAYKARTARLVPGIW